MLIKGQVSRIKLGNTLGEDQLYSEKFDYMLSNPPFGVSKMRDLQPRDAEKPSPAATASDPPKGG